MKKLATHPETGIMGEARDLQRRTKTFGANAKPLPQVPGILDSVKQEASNIIWLVMAATALFAGLCGIYEYGWEALAEAMSIVAVTAVILVVTSIADWHKDTRFVELRSMVKDEKLVVIRGKVNATSNISVWSLVVGDIIFLETGQRVPADCIIIESADLVVDETPDDATDDVLLKSKSAFLGRGSDPFLKADTMVNRGSCKAVVCCVGEHSTRGKYQADVSDEIN